MVKPFSYAKGRPFGEDVQRFGLPQRHAGLIIDTTPNSYAAEDGTTLYTAEDGATIYAEEN